MSYFTFGILLVIFPLSLFAGKIDPSQVMNDIKFEVTKETLKNGLTVLLHEDHSSPIVSIQQYYKVGSKYEKSSRTGLAHFFEHLMFKGTKKYAGKASDRKIQEIGGVRNAFTTKDLTGYYENVPSEQLEYILDLESDRMKNLMLSAEVLEAERQVVLSERKKSVDDSINGLLWETTFRTVFRVHPYRWPIIGWRKHLQAVSLEELQEFYKKHYGPNRSVLVITGDFSKKKVIKLVHKYYGSITSVPGSNIELTPEPEQRGPRQALIRKQIKSTNIVVAFKSPSRLNPDSYAMEVIAMALGSGDSSRLHRRLVYSQQTASMVSASNESMVDPGVFYIYVAPKAGVNRDKVMQAVYREIYKIREKGITEKELEKVKNAVMANYVSSLKTVSGKARALAEAEIEFGDYRKMFEEVGKFSQVTNEQVMEAAKKYLVPNRRSVVMIAPKQQQVEEQ